MVEPIAQARIIKDCNLVAGALVSRYWLLTNCWTFCRSAVLLREAFCASATLLTLVPVLGAKKLVIEAGSRAKSWTPLTACFQAPSASPAKTSAQPKQFSLNSPTGSGLTKLAIVSKVSHELQVVARVQFQTDCCRQAAGSAFANISV